MMLSTLARAVELSRQVVLPRPFPGPGRYIHRLAVACLVLPLFLLLQSLHWLGFLLDEIFFRGYRKVAIRRPVFVTGVPRSGTTYLHRLLASDPRFTTFSTWECLFAPSISERCLIRAVAALDRRTGSPLGRLLNRLERATLGHLEDIHPMTLASPEEDYLVLLPLLYCFILIVPFPEARWLWRMGCFDRDMGPAEKARILRWYERCLQKHLYVHGEQRTLLSKNASFGGMANSLAAHFPDSVLIICERDALQVIASQFNSLRGGLQFFGRDADEPLFRARLLDCLQYHYENLDRAGRQLGAQRALQINARDMARDPRATVDSVYALLGLAVAPETQMQLRAGEGRATHRPLPQPPLSVWGLDEAQLYRRFGNWCHSEARL